MSGWCGQAQAAFEPATRLLEALTKIRMSAAKARRKSEVAGAAYMAIQEDEVARIAAGRTVSAEPKQPNRPASNHPWRIFPYGRSLNQPSGRKRATDA
jgi:hypothetical protein